jgi:hypothetical protein
MSAAYADDGSSVTFLVPGEGSLGSLFEVGKLLAHGLTPWLPSLVDDHISTIAARQYTEASMLHLWILEVIVRH